MIDVAGPVAFLQTEGTAAIVAIGGAILTLAGIAVVYKYAKAAFFS